jgi:hypothetical protein
MVRHLRNKGLFLINRSKGFRSKECMNYSNSIGASHVTSIFPTVQHLLQLSQDCGFFAIPRGFCASASAFALEASFNACLILSAFADDLK